MTQPVQEPTQDRINQGHDFRVRQLFRRPGPPQSTPPSGECDCGQVVSGSAVNDVNYVWFPDANPAFTFQMLDPNYSMPHAIAYAFDHFNNIYVVNQTVTTSIRYPVYKFTAYGGFVAAIGTSNSGSANGQCNAPTDMCFDTSGNMYIVDAGNSRIQKWDADGFYVSKWGSAGSGNGQFNFTGGGFPSICFYNNELYVTDTGNDRVQVFNLSGSYQRQWGSAGTGNGQFSLANGIAADSTGTIYVVDDDVGGGSGASRVQWFDTGGTFLGKYDSASYGSGNGEFKDPNAIDIDADNNIYVADEGNFRVQKFDSSFAFVAVLDGIPSGNNVQGVAVRPNAVPI